MTTTVAERIRSLRHVRPELPAPPERRAIREAAGLTQAQVASAIGVSKQAIGLWESGLRTPRGPLLGRYVEALRAMQEPA
ncbi:MULTISPECIES: helix-turn-helix transcriptional regulator [Streptomyces rochei group]|uniref:helix-turn-helix transcriptional regulator n=1 Tax=Streptomyces rochei group TaxID=2867164 RepID=UPI00198EF9D2|nr:hypothetical protein GCM10010308_49960 [Streptomyces vinaceusdrappus]